MPYLLIMKFILHFLPLLLLCFAANAQIATYQPSLKDSTKNILFTQIENREEITNLPFGASLFLSNGTIKHDTAGRYIFTVNMAMDGTPCL